jgi:hypothetical protein
VNRIDDERDMTDFGLTNPEQLVDRRRVWSSRRKQRRATLAPVAPKPRAPIEDDVPTAAPAARPDLWLQHIDTRMGWQRDPRRQERCTSCLAGPGAPCVNQSGRPMRDVHPEGRPEKSTR